MEYSYFDTLDGYYYSYQVGESFINVDYSECEDDVYYYYQPEKITADPYYSHPAEEECYLKTDKNVKYYFFLTEEDSETGNDVSKEEFAKALNISEAELDNLLKNIKEDSEQKFIDDWYENMKDEAYDPDWLY